MLSDGVHFELAEVSPAQVGRKALGVNLSEGDIIEAGHEHHLRAINSMRRAGGIKSAVGRGLLTSGVMYECVRNNVEYLLAGSIRDAEPQPHR